MKLLHPLIQIDVNRNLLNISKILDDKSHYLLFLGVWDHKAIGDGDCVSINPTDQSPNNFIGFICSPCVMGKNGCEDKGLDERVAIWRRQAVDCQMAASRRQRLSHTSKKMKNIQGSFSEA